jgi:hypothetical protein
VFQRGGERHFRRRNNGVRHTGQDNTRVGAVSTKGGHGASGSMFDNFQVVFPL